MTVSFIIIWCIKPRISCHALPVACWSAVGHFKSDFFERNATPLVCGTSREYASKVCCHESCQLLTIIACDSRRGGFKPFVFDRARSNSCYSAWIIARTRRFDSNWACYDSCVRGCFRHWVIPASSHTATATPTDIGRSDRDDERYRRFDIAHTI